MIYFIVPAFNEAPNLPELLASIRDWVVRENEAGRIIAVNDGSTDETREILRDFSGMPVTVVEHGVNQGVAAAFRSGFYAWSAFPADPHDLVVTLEADNTSSLTILHEMVAQARSGLDIVLASCYAPGGEVVGTNPVRVILSFCANLILRCTPGMPRVHTFSSFYRVHRGPFLKLTMSSYGDRMIEKDGYVCVVELLLKFGLLGAGIGEVPLRLDGSRRKGPSKMNVSRTVCGYLDLFLSASAGSLSRPQNRRRFAAALLEYRRAIGE